MRALFAIRDARIYLTGQMLSGLGDTVMWLAMGIWVKTLTGSNGAAGLVFFAFAVPQLFAPLSGMLVDRLPRRDLLLATNLMVGAAVLVLLLVHGAGQVWLIYAVMVFYGAAYTVLSSGQTALLKQLLPDELLGDANALLRTVQEGFRLFGPLAGATLFAVFGGATVAIVDAVTFGAAALSLALLHAHHEPVTENAQHWRAELTAGFVHIARVASLRHVIGACAVGCLVIGVIESAVFAVVAGLGRPPTFVAVLVIAQGAGAVVTGSVAARAMRRIGEAGLTASALALFAIGAALLTDPALAVVLAGAVIMGGSLPWLVIGPMTLIQRVTPGHLVGRVSSAADMLMGTPQTISIAIGAALVTVIEYQLLLVGIATVTACAATYLMAYTHAHRFSSDNDADEPAEAGRR